MADISMAVQSMSIDNILDQLSDLKDNSAYESRTSDEPIWKQDVEALEAAISIISALQDEGISDAEGVKDLIFDYASLIKQNKDFHRMYIKSAAPVRKDGVWHCPEYNARTSYNHSYCHKCGKKIGGWKK